MYSVVGCFTVTESNVIERTIPQGPSVIFSSNIARKRILFEHR
jgi:hypothetical protein